MHSVGQARVLAFEHLVRFVACYILIFLFVVQTSSFAHGGILGRFGGIHTSIIDISCLLYYDIPGSLF